MAGGLNLYGYANGDPVNFSDPFGLCVDGVSTLACLWAVVEIGATIADVADLTITGVQYLRGRASGRELSVTAAGVGTGIVLAGGGYGRGARQAFRRGGRAQEAAALALPRLDQGRLHGALPSVGDLADPTRGDLTDFANDLRTSIDARRTIGRQHPGGFNRGHTRRLEDEMELLRVAENLLGGG